MAATSPSIAPAQVAEEPRLESLSDPVRDGAVAAPQNGRADQVLAGSVPDSAPATPAAPAERPANGAPPPASAGCTAPQLRRFIKSRPYVPMHELRRRFGINGADDDVTPVDLSDGRVYVGLPAREGGLLGELLRAGDIGFELSLDPRTPIVVGLYPMRPVPRA